MDTQPQERPRVLIVDDRKNWLEYLCEVLDASSYEIETATSYDDAKHKLRQRAYHVLVSDQRLVDADKDNIQGILLLDELSKLQDGAQAIIVTGYPKIEAAKKALMGRRAYDYILKHPEEGGPFHIRKYREQVKKAAKKAMGERESKIIAEISMSDLIPGLTHNQIAETLFHGETTPPDALKGVKKVLSWLLYPLQPLAHRMGRVWLSESDQVCEVICWSRNHGKAALIRIGKEQHPLETKWQRFTEESQYLVKKSDQRVSDPISGVSYIIEEMVFEDFLALVEAG